MFNINFSKYKYVSITLSFILIITGFIYTFAVHKGFAHSLDFNGGLRAVVVLDKNLGRADIEKFFKENTIEALIIQLDKEKNHYQIDIGLDAVKKIEEYNNLNKPANPEGNKTKARVTIDELIFMLTHGFKIPADRILSADQVGAIVGGELTSTGITLLISTLSIMTIYLSFRFQFKFALAASLALIHDLLFALAVIGVFQIKPSVPIIAALLTLFGYSINDTIVIFDRIRENMNSKVKVSTETLINSSINQTLGRTINTSFTTLISILALIIGGAVELYDFAFVLTFGIIIGTYSSIFVAAPVIEIYNKVFHKEMV
ncbi:MAG: protein translocase subunit SecF [Leptospiraceae bacterium]|nr:protein translocase subunit SecF [Leptospiraceae bacterium]